MSLGPRWNPFFKLDETSGVSLPPSYWAVMYCRDTTGLSYFPDSAPLLINVVHVLRAAQMSEGLAGD